MREGRGKRRRGGRAGCLSLLHTWLKPSCLPSPNTPGIVSKLFADNAIRVTSRRYSLKGKYRIPTIQWGLLLNDLGILIVT